MPEGIRQRLVEDHRNNKKSREWAGSVGLHLPPGGTPSNATKIRIYHYDDLVNLQEGNPGMRQRAFSQRNKLDTPRGYLFVELTREVLASSPDQTIDMDAFTQLNEDFQAFTKWAGQEDVYGQWSREAIRQKRLGVVGSIIKEDMNGRRFYDHELTETGNLDGLVTHSGAIGLGTEKASQTRQGLTISIVQKDLGVKPDMTFEQLRSRESDFTDCLGPVNTT